MNQEPTTEYINRVLEEFDKKFLGYWRGYAIPDEIKFFIASALSSLLTELEGKVREKKLPPIKHINHDLQTDCQVCSYNAALGEILYLIQSYQLKRDQ